MKSFALSMMSFLAACGGTGGGGAADPDAGTPADAPPTSAPVTVLAGTTGKPLTAVVLFHDAAGNLVERTPIGADGTAIGHPGSGGSVTVVPALTPNVGQFPIETFTAVEPGDRIAILSTPRPGSPGKGEMILKGVPSVGADGAYRVNGLGVWLVGATPEPPDLTVGLDGDAPATGDLLLSAVHTSGAAPAQYIVRKGVAFTPGTTLDLSGAAWTDPVPVPVTFVNAPATVLHAYAHLDLIAQGRRIVALEDTIVGTWTAHSATANLESPGEFGDATAMSLDIAYADRDALMTLEKTGSTVDLGALALPLAKSVDVAADRTISWQQTTTSIAPIATWMVLRNPKTQLDWKVLVPGDRRSYRLPALPADLAAEWPGDKTATVPVSATFIATDDPGGYAAYRNEPSGLRMRDWALGQPRSPHGYRAMSTSGPTN
jgi:hypothetical protein